MKKDRKIKSAGMSDRDKNLLFIVGGILLVVLVIQFGFRNFLAENKEQKATKAALEAELKELDVIQKNEKEYTAQTEEWKKKTKEYYKEFPAMVKARDQILYASDMEKRYDSLRITKVSMEAGELVAENQEAGLSIYGVPEILEFTVSYSQLKDWLHRIPKEEERKSINEMVLTLDEASGNLVGDIRMKQYYMLGTGEEYQPAEINDVQKGTDNIFGGASGIAPEDVQQTKASQQAGETQATETLEQ